MFVHSCGRGGKRAHIRERERAHERVSVSTWQRKRERERAREWKAERVV